MGVHNFPPFGTVLSIFPSVSNAKFLQFFLRVIGSYLRGQRQLLNLCPSGVVPKALRTAPRFLAFARCDRATSASPSSLLRRL